MHITVISDSHGNFKAVEKAIMRDPSADWIIHLGDGEKDLNSFILRHLEFEQKIIRVAGNCDTTSLAPDKFILPLLGHKIFATHGHRYAVRNDLDIIKRNAEKEGCDIILYGHTHIRYNNYEDGFYIMNPGSCSCPHDKFPPSFGRIDILPSGILTNIVDI